MSHTIQRNCPEDWRSCVAQIVGHAEKTIRQEAIPLHHLILIHISRVKMFIRPWIVETQKGDGVCASIRSSVCEKSYPLLCVAFLSHLLILSLIIGVEVVI